MLKPRTRILAGYFGRVSCWALGLGCILIGIGEALNCALVCHASERQE